MFHFDIIAGSEKYRSITKAWEFDLDICYKSHYKKSIGALLFYDLTNKDSFTNLQEWLKEVLTYDILKDTK